jgi:hypothetical protein
VTSAGPHANPLEFIREKVRAGQIFWTYHVNMRLRGRFVERRHILESVETYEVVEAYPTDKYLPSYLILAQPAGDAIHVLFAVDVPGGVNAFLS